jgi:hypothetical protein
LEDLGLLSIAQISLVIKTRREEAELDIFNANLAQDLAKRKQKTNHIRIEYDDPDED